ncbi:enoyl-CoA hydratase-related protein [Phenylobacterium sp.]|uniref:enoyl-CoA hydratase-related protein n=1 Tax=Phenylobacterium sp. TaxID=1871053 RepID=UPI0028978F3F|nr:enoyl-CoA hydratase-related protein [Phenylobacterium sp.]
MELKTTRYELDGHGVAVITLSRPKRRNAWTGRMHTEYRWLLREADADQAVRVIVVTGDPEGQAFCAGADLGALEGHSEKGRYDPGVTDDIARPGFGVDPNFDAAFAYHFGVGKPVIAAINGAAAGVGLVLAAFADLRFAATGVKFTAAHGRFNFPAEFGLSWVLPRIVGLTHANDILLSSRTFTSEEASAMGFLNRLVEPQALMPTVTDYARTLAANVAPGSARETKRQIYRDLHRDAAAAVVEAERLLEAMIKDPDYKEGVKAWMEKRPAQWAG